MTRHGFACLASPALDLRSGDVLTTPETFDLRGAEPLDGIGAAAGQCMDGLVRAVVRPGDVKAEAIRARWKTGG